MLPAAADSPPSHSPSPPASPSRSSIKSRAPLLPKSVVSSPPLPRSPQQLFNFPWPFPEKPSLLYRWGSNAIIYVVFGAAKFVTCVLNRLVVRPEQKSLFLRLIEQRGKPLITVSNHRCVMDDPLMWGIFTFREFHRNIARFRYTLAAHDICFTKYLHTFFFSRGRCVPCYRGAGVHQLGVDHCVQMLNQNGWVHIFPEGKVTPQPIRIKWGVGRMIADSRVPPTLLPIWLDGMNSIWTNAPIRIGQYELASFYRPRIGQTVRVTVGEPIDTADWLLHANAKNGAPEGELEQRKRLADLVQEALFALGRRVEQPQTAQN